MDNAKSVHMDNSESIHPAVKLRHIRTFLDIASEGNLSAVARRQGITQPALSRTLAELETLLGQPLFLRQGRRLVLTEGGALFRRHATASLQSLEAGAAALRPRAGGTLRVGVLPTVASWFFPRVALRFREIRPEMVLAVETGPHSHLMRQLREGGIDLMIGRLPEARDMAGLSFEHLYEEDIVLAARQDHPLLDLPPAEALARSPLILPPVTAIIRRPVDDYLASVGLPNLRPAVETVSLAIGRAICRGSDALWFISRGVIAEELERGEMALLPVKARFLAGAVGTTRRQTHEAPGLETLEEIARDIARTVPSTVG